MRRICEVLCILAAGLLCGCNDEATPAADRAVSSRDLDSDRTTPDTGLPDLPRPDTVQPDATVPAASAPDTVNPAYKPPGAWVTIAAGTFTMGSPTGEPCREPFTPKETQHKVTLTHKVEIQTTEVTQAQFNIVMKYLASKFTTCGTDCPVESVTWSEAATYCNALSAKKGLSQCYTCTGAGTGVSCKESKAYSGAKTYTCPGYRLPTEAEWEYAYRAGTTSAFYSGAISSCTGTDANAGAIGWYTKNSSNTPHQVAKKLANAWGLYDMAGNVSEWCHDWTSVDLGSSAVTDPVGALSSTEPYRNLRGGSWSSAPLGLRAANRDANPPTKGYSHVGFRCVRSL